MSVSDFNAEKKWRKLSKEMRERLIHNAFCSKCFVTTIVDYSVLDNEYGILLDRKSTRLNSSHVSISYAVFCLKKKKTLEMTEDAHTDVAEPRISAALRR